MTTCCAPRVGCRWPRTPGSGFIGCMSLDISICSRCLRPQRPKRLPKRAHPWARTSAVPAATASGLVVEAAGVMRAVLGAGNPGSVGVTPRLSGAPMLVVEPSQSSLVLRRPGHRESFSGHGIVACRPMAPSGLAVCSRRGGNSPRNDGRGGEYETQAQAAWCSCRKPKTWAVESASSVAIGSNTGLE